MQIPRIRFTDIPAVVRRSRSQLPGFTANTATHTDFSDAEVTNLRDDISNTATHRDPVAASQIVPEGALRNRVKGIVTGNSLPQVLGGGAGAVGGGLLGAGMGALTAGLSRGRKYAPVGLLSAIPGAIGGYYAGHNKVTRSQLLETLSEDLGPGAGIKRANVEEGFKEVLRHIHKYRLENRLTMAEFSQSIRALKVGRGRNLSPPERLLIRKVGLGQQGLPIANYTGPMGRAGTELPRSQFDPVKVHKPTTLKPKKGWKPKTPKTSKIPKLKGLPQPKTFATGKAVGIAAGATAALAMLGLGAAYWPRDDDSNLKD